jgi:hypothetical protein
MTDCHDNVVRSGRRWRSGNLSEVRERTTKKIAKLTQPEAWGQRERAPSERRHTALDL